MTIPLKPRNKVDKKDRKEAEKGRFVPGNGLPSSI